MNKLNVLLLGGGGREHALAWKIAQSEMLDTLYVAPGNGGTSEVATNLDFGDSDFDAMKAALLEHRIDLVVVGPEAPLVKGVRAFIENDPATSHVKVVGPGTKGAMMEGSKSFSKQFMEKHGIPTARFGEFNAQQVEAANSRLLQRHPRSLVAVARSELLPLAGRLASAMRLRLSRARGDLRGEASRLDNLSPLAVLGRGYAIAALEGGGIIFNAQDVNPGDRVDVRVHAGSFEARVTKVRPMLEVDGN